MRSKQVDQCATQVDNSACRIDQSASQVDQSQVQVEESTGCRGLAQLRGAACLAELKSQRRHGLRLRAVLPVGVSRGASLESVIADGLFHEALDRHGRVVNGGRQANPVSECPDHREGEQTLPSCEHPSCAARAKGLAYSYKTKRYQSSSKFTICTKRSKSNKQKQNPSATCEGTLGVTSVSLRRFAYDARSRCHSYNVLR